MTARSGSAIAKLLVVTLTVGCGSSHVVTPLARGVEPYGRCAPEWVGRACADGRTLCVPGPVGYAAGTCSQTCVEDRDCPPSWGSQAPPVCRAFEDGAFCVVPCASEGPLRLCPSGTRCREVFDRAGSSELLCQP